MAKSRQYVVLAVLLSLVVLVVGWMFVVSPKKAEAAELRSQAESEESLHATLQQQITMLKEDEKRLPEFEARLAEIAQEMPGEPAIPSLIRELIAAADKANVDLRDVSPGSPEEVVVAPPTMPTTPTTPSTGTTPGAPAADGSATGAPATGAATPGAATTGAPAAPAPTESLTRIPLSITVVGTYDELKAFLLNVEELRRALLVRGLDISIGDPLQVNAAGADGETAANPNEYDGRLTVVLSGNVFTIGLPAPLVLLQPPVDLPERPADEADADETDSDTDDSTEAAS